MSELTVDRLRENLESLKMKNTLEILDNYLERAVADKLNGQTIEIASKVGVDGRLFGSVTNADIAEAVDKLGFEIKKSQVRTPLGAIKAIGEYTITVGLMSDITADITVKVVPEA